MDTLEKCFPSLLPDLLRALETEADADAALSEQLKTCEVERVTFDSEADAGYIYLRPTRPLNVVEANIIRSRHNRTVTLDLEFGAYLDVDNFERVTGIELLHPSTRLRALLLFRANV